MPDMCAVLLVGFMGAGKTSVGRVLSRKLGWPFKDLDDQVQARDGRAIEQIFRESGESEFRRLETAALRELLTELASSPWVVAMGGGAFVQPENRALIEAAGILAVFLYAPAEELFRRCERDVVRRPLQGGFREFQNLYEVRRPHYLKAGLTIDTNDKDVDTVAAEVACGLGLQSLS